MRCHHVGDDQPRELPNGDPCPEPHCRVCWRNHAPVTCPDCVGKVRDDMRDVVKLARDLPHEAEAKGVDSEAADLDGPAADPRQWRQRGRYGARFTAEQRMGEEHPLWVLGTWDMLTTEHLEHHRAGRVTVSDAAAYLEVNLTYLAADVDYPFEDLARDLRRCRAHLEAVLHDGEQIERGAPCVACGTQVERLTDDKGRVSYWCKRCRSQVSEDQYRYAVSIAHVAHADRLPARELAERIGVAASTVRRWVAVRRMTTDPAIVDGVSVPGETIELPPLLRSCGRGPGGRKLYRVSAAEQLRDQLRGETA